MVKNVSKAILVIDMPNNCLNCPCLQTHDCDDWCGVTGVTIYTFTERDKSCPLKSMPQIEEIVRE